jgi:NAD(P)-dependent dehydrogenase (short-subunit alcohol dehydrogenase family)
LAYSFIGAGVGEFGISLNAIAPGLVEHEGQNAPKALTELQLKERSIKRLQTPDDLMGTPVLIASSDSDVMTGQAIVEDGGIFFYCVCNRSMFTSILRYSESRF